MPNYDALSELRSANKAMAASVREQIDDDLSVPSMNSALGNNLAHLAETAADTDDALRAGAALRKWILDNATEDERFEWNTGMPHPDIDRFEVAAAALNFDFDTPLFP